MRALKTFTLIFTSTLVFGQYKSPGLFGNCDVPNWGYMCQQIDFKDNGTFTFYDLLHLNGWSLSQGNWRRIADTLILNSQKPFYSIDYKNTSTSDSITIHVTDSIEPLSFATIQINSEPLSTPLSGVLKVLKHGLDTIFVFYPSTCSGPILLNKDKLKTVSDLYINLFQSQLGTISFLNKKWLLEGDKLYHTKASNGSFDKEKYFLKAKKTDLKYTKGK